MKNLILLILSFLGLILASAVVFTLYLPLHLIRSSIHYSVRRFELVQKLRGASREGMKWRFYTLWGYLVLLMGLDYCLGRIVAFLSSSIDFLLIPNKPSYYK